MGEVKISQERPRFYKNCQPKGHEQIELKTAPDSKILVL